MKDSISGTWHRRLRQLRGLPVVIETDLAPYEATLDEIDRKGRTLANASDDELARLASSLRRRARSGDPVDELLVDAFALAREAAERAVGMRPFDVQVLAGIALHRGKLAEMGTGEGKTLAAVLPAFLNGLTGRGVHVLTFNDYLARRDADWMGPVYRWLGIRVGSVQHGMAVADRSAAYAADVTYATAKEAGFDFLRMNLCRDPAERVHRPFHYAIVDEADSILIDEARVPLVIAGDRQGSPTGLSRVAELVRELCEGRDHDVDENRRNVVLSERGVDRVESELGCGDLYAEANLALLTEINQALHVHVLLRRDVDYIVRDGAIELVDEFTGRVVADRRWPDGLQAALEAKEGLTVRPGGRILGSITLQHFLGLYPRLAGMTATAQPAADELARFYGLHVVVVPPNRPYVRDDHPDVVFVGRSAKLRALVREIRRVHATRRPVLVGTSSVEESEELAAALTRGAVACRVLNAKNDEEEAGIVAQAGAAGSVTISTNMAGRGTDIRLGGADERGRDEVAALGGLYVIGTNRHESRRIDDQLRGRAGRQGDPGSSRFFVSLGDPLMVRFGIDELIPARFRPPGREEPVDRAAVLRKIERLQQTVEAQNFEIRSTLDRYSALVEKQRRSLHLRREAVLLGEESSLCTACVPGLYAALLDRFGEDVVRDVEREIALHHLDRGWEEHLASVAQLRDGIHLVRIGGRHPEEEFHKTVAKEFWKLQAGIDRRIVATFERVEVGPNGIDAEREGLRGPSSTWTYLVNDRVASDLHGMLAGPGNFAFAAAAALSTGPLMVAEALWRRWRRRRQTPPDDDS